MHVQLDTGKSERLMARLPGALYSGDSTIIAGKRPHDWRRLAIRFYGRPGNSVLIEHLGRQLFVLNWALFGQVMGGREDF